MDLWLEGYSAVDGQVECAAVLHTRTGEHRVWFRVPTTHAGWLTDRADPFVIAFIFVAMAEARSSRRPRSSVKVHGSVGSGLIPNLYRFQEAWGRWCPEDYHPVEFVAEDETEGEPAAWCEPPTRRLLAFSGGVDSCFSARRARRAAPHEQVVGVMVHGFDVPLHDTVGFDRAFDVSRVLLASLQSPLVGISTNFRDLPGRWHDTHGAGIAACLHLLAGGARGGIIGSTHPYDHLRLPWGSGVLTDPMLSSEPFPVASDGASHSRREKSLSLRDWPEAMSSLRVCWRGPDHGRNCGRCSKCIFTGLYFAAEDGPVPSCLPLDPLPEAVAALSELELSAMERITVSALVQRARHHQIGAAWVDALEQLAAGGSDD